MRKDTKSSSQSCLGSHFRQTLRSELQPRQRRNGNNYRGSYSCDQYVSKSDQIEASTRVSSKHSVTSQMVIVECSKNSEASRLFGHARYFAGAFNSQFVSTLIRRWDQNFNPNISPHWRAT